MSSEVEIKVPTVGESISEVFIGEWYVGEGGHVAMDGKARRVQAPLVQTKATIVGERKRISPWRKMRRRVPRCQLGVPSFLRSFVPSDACRVCTV